MDKGIKFICDRCGKNTGGNDLDIACGCGSRIFLVHFSNGRSHKLSV